MTTTSTTHQDTTLDAGSFGNWLAQARSALRGNGGMNVPCGDCVGCCTSSYSILLRPHDAALDIVPVKFLSSVPGLTYPHAKMNPLENGHCPMFKKGKCSIYSTRPQTCLDYDCRVFAAAGIDAGTDRPVISKRVSEWRFTYASDEDYKAHAAVRAAAAFIASHIDHFPAAFTPVAPTGIAVLAIKIYTLFMGTTAVKNDTTTLIDNIIKANNDFYME